MSQGSNTIVSEMKRLLTRVNDRDALVTVGFVRELDLGDVPIEIINYCVIYAFLKINELPMELVGIIMQFYNMEDVHLINNSNNEHWKIHLDDILETE